MIKKSKEIKLKKFLLKLYYIYLKKKDYMIILYNKNFFSKLFIPKVKSTDETIEKLLSSKVSMSRYGDGEFSLMNRVNLKFQDYDNNLEKRLKEIIVSNKKNHIVCIPDVFEKKDIYTENASKYWEKYIYLNLHKLKFINKRKEYYNSLVTRLYIDTKNKIKVKKRYKKIKMIWENREILLVEGNKSRIGIGNNLFEKTKDIKRIICPSKNAYFSYEKILQEVLKNSKEKLILIALGPTATVLSYDLSQKGYQALDIGHIDIEYEWFLSNAYEKTPVKNKYIGEILNGDIVDDLDDKIYKKQIISKVL